MNNKNNFWAQISQIMSVHIHDGVTLFCTDKIIAKQHHYVVRMHSHQAPVAIKLGVYMEDLIDTLSTFMVLHRYNWNTFSTPISFFFDMKMTVKSEP